MASRGKALLDPKKKPVGEIAAYLARKVRTTPAGAKSLAHILAIVPTAESSRRLREELAKRFGAIAPPDIRPTSRLVELDEDSVATPTEELVAMREALGANATFDTAAGYVEIRRIIGANAYEMADVHAKAAKGELFKGDLADVECERWANLAELEKRYHLALAKRGKTDRTRAVKAALANGVRFEGIEEVVVAMVLEPLPLVERVISQLDIPVTELLPDMPEDGFASIATDDIIQTRTPGEEGRRIAGIFAEVKETEALPALCVADAGMFTEVQSALGAKGCTVVNPAETPLSASPLAQSVLQMALLERTRAYDVFSAFIRGGDARRWIKAELGFDDAKYTAALVDLDNRQRQLLPATIDDIATKTTGPLRAIFEFVATALRKRDLRSRLRYMFAGYMLDEADPKAREFAAAATAIAELLDECFSAGLDSSLALDLFVRRLKDSTYCLEPDEGDAVSAEGWLEIPYLDADELYVCGFQEGVVPQSVVGHPFVPDSLRKSLGLPDNASRAARDLKILELAVSCRPKGAVKVFFHSVDTEGDVAKPSRLLFACRDDGEFVRRAREFYSCETGTKEIPLATVPEKWKLDLPIPPDFRFTGKTSPSSLDTYMKCPFTWYLKKLFTEGEEYDNEELDASEYGHLVHDALEMWGNGELRDSDDSDAIAAELSSHVESILASRFGTEIPAIVALQGESAKGRLKNFASVQAAWRKEGWRIVASEGKLSYSLAREGGMTVIAGRSDRIDRNEATGEWCVIDYKTWDSADRATAYDAKSGKWNSLQLPLYCAMLDADNGDYAAAKRDNIKAVYCVIGKTAAETLFSKPISGALVPEAEDCVKDLLSRMDRGIFWPPGRIGQRADWEFHFADWFAGSPEEGLREEWLADQKRRLGE